jgi:hypothetical protein
MMQMLYVGGCPVVCEPGNELVSGECSDQLSALREIALGLTDGKAIKCLDPHRFLLPPDKQYKIIWMRRNFKEQAKSITKFMQMLLGMRTSKRAAIREFEKSLPIETRKCHRLLSGYPMIDVEFENLIHNPKQEAKRVADFIGMDLDIDKMAAVVFVRSTDCYQGMLELELMKKV